MEVVNVVLIALGLAGAAGLVTGYYRANLAKSTLELYRQDNEALRNRVDTLEGERADLRERIETLAGRLASLQEERKMLRDLATGASAVESLGRHLEDRLNTVESLLRKITSERRGTDGT